MLHRFLHARRSLDNGAQVVAGGHRGILDPPFRIGRKPYVPIQIKQIGGVDQPQYPFGNQVFAFGLIIAELARPVEHDTRMGQHQGFKRELIFANLPIL